MNLNKGNILIRIKKTPLCPHHYNKSALPHTQHNTSTQSPRTPYAKRLFAFRRQTCQLARASAFSLVRHAVSEYICDMPSLLYTNRVADSCPIISRLFQRARAHKTNVAQYFHETHTRAHTQFVSRAALWCCTRSHAKLTNKSRLYGFSVWQARSVLFTFCGYTVHSWSRALSHRPRHTHIPRARANSNQTRVASRLLDFARLGTVHARAKANQTHC